MESLKLLLPLLLLLQITINAEPQPDFEELPVARVIRQVNFPGQGRPGSRPGSRPRPRPQPFPGGRPGGRPPNGRPQVGPPVASGGCQCTQAVYCASELAQIPQGCSFPDGSAGVCCPQSTLSSFQPQKGTGDSKVLSSKKVPVRLGNLNMNQVNAACQKGLQTVQGLPNIENNLIRNNVMLPRNTPASNHLKVFKISNRAKRMDKQAQAIIEASKNMAKDFSLSIQQAAHGLRNLNVGTTTLGNMCPVNPRCNPQARYRTADGSCNNINNPTWGMSNTPTQRILPPTYDDGVQSPRTRSATGGILPNVRGITNSALVDVDAPDLTFTSSVMQWAQFMDHDFAHVPFPSLENGEGIECCPGGRPAEGANAHPRCWPIDTTGDPFFRQRGRSCMNFVRSMVAVGAGNDCTFGYAEQLNQLTHWIDGSNVYGSTPEEQQELRAFRNGLLKTSANNLLPINPDQGGDCEGSERGAKCYLAGDSRSNEQPGLTAIHTLWLRQHNNVAQVLQNRHRNWDDETVFQETRRIIIAQIQHITYNEWLPIIVGSNFMRSFGINTLQSGFSFDYNPNFNPNMNNEFATAAFRFGHSMVQGTLRLFSRTGSVSTIQLRDHFNSPHLIQNEGKYDDIVRSFTQLAPQRFDSFVTQDLSNHLFQTLGFDFGMDLMSINLHRGRDHGIASYNDMRQVCGLGRASSFNQFQDSMDPDKAANLANIYASPDDVDFFVGGMSERPVSGGILGWTFLCVVGDQFARLKKGDRFFYDLGGQTGSFSQPQLQEIRKTSWARILCDNSDISAVQPLAFLQTNNRLNQPANCRSQTIPTPNFNIW